MSKARDTVETLRTVLVDGDVTNANFTGADLDIAKGGTGASTAGAARTALGLAIGSDVQAFNSAIMVDGDIGTTVQAHDADTAKLDANANFTGTLQRGGTDVLVTGDVTNANFTGADLEIAKGGTGASSAGAARTALGLAIGTDVLAPDGSAANLTNLPASGSADFVASGTLPNGATVILKSNGQVEVVAQSAAAISKSVPLGSETVFESTGTTTDIDVAFDPNNANKFVVVFKQNSGYPAAVVGSVSGSSLSFGTTVVLYSGNSAFTNIAFDPNTANKFVVSYRGVNSYAMSRVGTISGTSLSFGSEDIVGAQGSTNYIRMAFDPNTAGRFVAIYRSDTQSDNGYARCGIVSGTDVTYGTAVRYNTGTNDWKSIAFDPNTANKFVVVYEDGGNSAYGTGIVGTLSGTNTISFGSEYVFNSGHTNYPRIAFDPNTAGKFVVAYQDNSNSGYGTSIIGKVAAGGTITYGAEQVFNATDSDWISIDFDPNTANRFIVGFANWGNSGAASIVVGTISDLAISFSSISVINAATSYYIRVSFDPNTAGKFVVAYRDQGNSNYGTAIVCQLSENAITNMTAANFLGTATAAYTNGQTAKIMLQGGISTNQSSLAIGSTYYVQPTGTLATTPSSPSVVAGKAISATTLLLKGI